MPYHALPYLPPHYSSQPLPHAQPPPHPAQASFSLVEGDTVIPAHAGPTNARLRAHLGLLVPKKGEVLMTIANQVGVTGAPPDCLTGPQTVTWRPGQWTVIDDSFEHQVQAAGTGG